MERVWGGAIRGAGFRYQISRTDISERDIAAVHFSAINSSPSPP